MTYGIHPLGTFSVGHDTFSLYRLDIGLATETDAALGLLPGGSGTGATAAEIWSYTLSNGLTAEATLVAIHAMLEALTVPTAVEVANAVWAKELP